MIMIGIRRMNSSPFFQEKRKTVEGVESPGQVRCFFRIGSVENLTDSIRRNSRLGGRLLRFLLLLDEKPERRNHDV